MNNNFDIRIRTGLWQGFLDGAQGFQTDESIRCKAMPDGDRLLVSFVSFGTGKVENKYGVKLYSVGQPLFAIAQAPNGLRTTWEGYAQALGDGASSAAFKKVGP